MSSRVFLTAFPLLLTILPRVGIGQQVTIGTPFQSSGDRFFESTNLGWTVSGPGFFAKFGGSAPVPFGGFNPNAGLSGATGFNGGDWSGRLYFNASQGSSRRFIGTTPTVTTLNGQPAFFTSGVQRPFVTGLSPLVNPQFAFPNRGPVSPVTLITSRPEWQNRDRTYLSTSPKPREKSVTPTMSSVRPLPPTRAERERQIKAEENQRSQAAQGYYERGRRAESDGKIAVARQYYRMASRRAEGDLKHRVNLRLQEIEEDRPAE